MARDESAIRLECLRLAEAAQRAGDSRDMITIAEEFLRWVRIGEGRGAKHTPEPLTMQTLFPFELPARNERPTTIKKMVMKLLEEADPNGLTALQILAEIQKRWHPELKRTSLSPQLSRLKVLDEEIIHEHGVYRLNKQDAPSGGSDEASEN